MDGAVDYTYDATCNRIGGDYVTGTNNETTADSDFTYTYDDEGRRATRTDVVSSDVTSYAWDARGRWTSS